MKKKLDTRFPAARIKKIMQADEEVGKIAMATPVLISKALELFLQDLCDRTYDITLKRGAKTMTSFHLKECVRSHRVFDFLGEIVSRVPDLGSDTGGENGRRRKMGADGDNDDSCEEDVKRSRGELQAISTRGRGRGRSRGRGRGNSEKQRVRVESDNLEDQEALSSPQLSDECEGYAQMSPETKLHEGESSEITIAAAASRPMPKDFDLNVDLDEHGEVAGVQKEEQQDAYTHPAWIASTSNQDNSQVINIQLHQSQNVLQPEEDYDCEDEN